jgi:hypothetical protein
MSHFLLTVLTAAWLWALGFACGCWACRRLDRARRMTEFVDLTPPASLPRERSRTPNTGKSHTVWPWSS